ncbi:ComF family protein [Luteimonas aquatica]|uniref:ComF family protein n=1 Tax=Luteimonas aquatica TaxID=450364 RepID=UPI001F587E5B|nr:ComF family protein [Luteimonas aquatica]
MPPLFADIAQRLPPPAGHTGLLQHLWPARCLLCREPADGAHDLCAACAAVLPWNRHACPRCAVPLPPADDPTAPASACGRCLRHPPPLQSARAACRYGFPLDRLLPRFKFHGDLAAGRLLAQLMAAACGEYERPEAMIAIPLHHARLRSRGYDQAWELARPLARALDLPLLRHALIRRRDTAPQSRLDAGQRRGNLRRAFAVNAGAALPAHVALIDDVMTTGATLHAAARALHRAGAMRVDAWVCARVPAPG